MFDFANKSAFTRICLRLFLGSVVVSALVGAAALAIPTGNWLFELRVFLTTMIIAAASVCGLACGGCWSLGKRALPVAGVILAGIASSLGLFGVWVDVDSETYWKTTAVAATFGVACAHLSMLLMAKLHRSYRWAHLVAYQVELGLAAVVAGGIAFDLFDSEGYWRLTGVLSIASAAITVIIPVLRHLSRDLEEKDTEQIDSIVRIDEKIALCKKELLDLQAKRQRLLDDERAAAPASRASMENDPPQPAAC